MPWTIENERKTTKDDAVIEEYDVVFEREDFTGTHPQDELEAWMFIVPKNVTKIKEGTKVFEFNGNHTNLSTLIESNGTYHFCIRDKFPFEIIPSEEKANSVIIVDSNETGKEIWGYLRKFFGRGPRPALGQSFPEEGGASLVDNSYDETTGRYRDLSERIIDMHNIMRRNYQNISWVIESGILPHKDPKKLMNSDKLTEAIEKAFLPLDEGDGSFDVYFVTSSPRNNGSFDQYLKSMPKSIIGNFKERLLYAIKGLYEVNSISNGSLAKLKDTSVRVGDDGKCYDASGKCLTTPYPPK